MSFQAMAWAVKQTPSGSKEKFVLLMLANYASNENGDCHPSLGEICDTTLLSRDSVIRAIKSLEEEGYLSIEKKRVGRVNLPNSYSLNLHRVVAQSDHEPSRNLQGGSRTERPGVVAVCDPNLSVEPISSVVARPAYKHEALSETLLEAAGLQDFRAERGTGLINLAPVLGLLDAGFSLEDEILPAIRFKTEAGFKFRSWSLLTQIVPEFAEKRRGAAKAVRTPPPKPVDWQARVNAYYDEGIWPMAWGPNPDDPGCDAPAELLKRTAA